MQMKPKANKKKTRIVLSSKFECEKKLKRLEGKLRLLLTKIKKVKKERRKNLETLLKTFTFNSEADLFFEKDNREKPKKKVEHNKKDILTAFQRDDIGPLADKLNKQGFFKRKKNFEINSLLNEKPYKRKKACKKLLTIRKKRKFYSNNPNKSKKGEVKETVNVVGNKAFRKGIVVLLYKII
jgi:hypothetical protein